MTETKSSQLNRIDLPGGWYLVRCLESDSKHYNDWFLSTPDGYATQGYDAGGSIWVAKFWDGPQAGLDDSIAFARSLGVKIE